MTRERVHDWPGGRLPIIRVFDMGPDTRRGHVGEPMLSMEEIGESEAVPFGDGLALLQPLSIPLRNPQGEDLAELELGVVDGRPACVAIHARGHTRLTGTFLRQLPPLRKLVTWAINGKVVRVMRHDDGRIVGELYVRGQGAGVYIDRERAEHPFGALREELTAELEDESKASARQALTDEFLKQVTSTYKEAAAKGVSTQKAIQERWPTSPANARRWVAHARRRGFLGPAPGPRTPGEQRKEESNG
jgi:hypothetical protein